MLWTIYSPFTDLTRKIPVVADILQQRRGWTQQQNPFKNGLAEL